MSLPVKLGLAFITGNLLLIGGIFCSYLAFLAFLRLKGFSAWRIDRVFGHMGRDIPDRSLSGKIIDALLWLFVTTAVGGNLLNFW